MPVELLSPAQVWGLIPRFVGFIYILAFAALLPQHHVMAGSSRLASMAPLRARVQRDFPGLRKFVTMPSLLWWMDSDNAQRGMCIVGCLCGAIAIYGGPLSLVALALAWVLWLSLEPRGLVFPWDTMLQEVGFLALFLPTAAMLPTIEAAALPLPSVAFLFRWTLLRLMLGFAKVKFIGANKTDALYLRGFFVWMPLPTPLGWLGHHAPSWFLRRSLEFMFVAEAIAPVLGMFSGTVRLVGFGFLVALMIGIQLTGNWGFFNIGYALLCVSLLDTESSIFDLGKAPWVDSLTSWPDLGIHLAMLVLFLASLFYFVIANSWITRSWVNWTPDLFPVATKDRAKFWRIHRLFAPLRAIAGLRLVNGYGVFPPKATAPMRLTPVFEGSDDGIAWKQYGYRHLPSFPHERPPFIAPYHARLDQYLTYVPVGTDTTSLLGAILPLANPYTIGCRTSLVHLLMQRMLAHDRKVLAGFGHNPFPHAPPKYMRVGLVAMTPTRPSELAATGHWWHIRRIGTLFRPMERGDWAERVLIPEPELFHPDLVEWKRLAKPIEAITAAHARGLTADQAVLEGGELHIEDLDCFWEELVPMLQEDRNDWTRIHDRAAAIEARFGVEGLFRLERVLERYAWLLRLVTTAYREGTAEPALPAMPNFRYHMLLHELIVDGRDAFEQALASPSLIVERAAASTQASQLWTIGLMRYDQVMLHAQCFRVYDMGLKGVEGLPSFLEYHDFLCDLVPPGEQFRPVQVKHDDGEHTIEGFYPPPALIMPRDGAGAGGQPAE